MKVTENIMQGVENRMFLWYWVIHGINGQSNESNGRHPKSV